MERQSQLYQRIRDGLLCADMHQSKSGLLEESTAAWTRSDPRDLDPGLWERREAHPEHPCSAPAPTPGAPNQPPRERADVGFSRHVIPARRNDANGR